MTTLAGKAALVTGAGSGIGRATALLMAQRGASVAVSDLRRDAAEAVASEISAAGGRAIGLVCDIGQETSVADAVMTTTTTFGRLDILHNNAAFMDADAIAADVDVLTIPTAAWDRNMEVTLRGTMLGCRYGVQAMLRSGGGAIVNTASSFGLAAHNANVAYGVAKGAITVLTKYVATAFGRQGVRCNAVAPSLVLTPAVREYVPQGVHALHERSTVLGRLAEPEDIARVVAFLASDDAAYVTGHIVPVDGGTTAHLPTYDAFRQHFNDVGAAA